jgi:glycosyltransferase involved in cell wall biosynthesis
MVENIFILMPAYNAGATIESVFERIPAEARRRIRRYVVVNDGSSDDTEAALARLRTRFPTLVALTHARNRGYGAAEKTLLRYALDQHADLAIVLHSDGQYSPESIPELTAPFDEDSADMVQGSRMLGSGALKGGMPVYKFVANKVLTAIENLAFGMKMAEYHSGYMLYSRRTMASIPFERLSDSFDFDLEMIVMARVLGLRVAEIPIPTVYAGEVSHLKPVRYGLRVLRIVGNYLLGRYGSLARCLD